MTPTVVVHELTDACTVEYTFDDVKFVARVSSHNLPITWKLNLGTERKLEEYAKARFGLGAFPKYPDTDLYNLTYWFIKRVLCDLHKANGRTERVRLRIFTSMLNKIKLDEQLKRDIHKEFLNLYYNVAKDVHTLYYTLVLELPF